MPVPPTRTMSDAPGVTDTVAVARPPSPPGAAPVPNPSAPFAPVATIVTLSTPAGTVKFCEPPVKLNVLEPFGGKVIVKVCAPLVPPAVVTVTVRGPVGTRSITKLAVSDVALPTTTLATVTPPGETATVVAPTTKLVPVSVTATMLPRAPRFGETLVSVGGAQIDREGLAVRWSRRRS